MLAAGGLRAQEVAPQTVRELQVKAATEPFAPVKVKTSGIVTWIDPTEGKYFQLQDQTGGVQVSFTNIDWPLVEDTVEVEGVLERGPYAPVISNAKFRHKGKGSLPKAANASGGGLVNGEYNGELVDIHGWVRSAEMISSTTFSAVLNSGSARVTVRVSNARNLDPQKLIAAKVWMRGVAIPVRARGGLRQLVDVQVLASREEDFHVEQLEPADPWQSPVRPLQEAFQYRPGFTRGDRFRIRGQMVYHRDGVAYLNDGRSGVAVRGAGSEKLRPGDEVEAVGFPDLEDFLPVLSDAVFTSFPPQGEPVKPKPMTVEELLDGLQHAGYVTVRGRLLDRLQTPSADRKGTLVLALNTPRGVFTAEMEHQGARIPHLEEGATLDVSGICLVSTDGAGNSTSFKILVPGPASVAVVERASFFTVKRLLVMLSAALGGMAAVAIFAYFTSRRNLELAAEMREKKAVMAERNRLARDLHDTLEQGLTGIHLQLHGIGKTEEDASPDTRERLEAVNVLVKQCHAEMRHSIWNLRSVALEQFDLVQALDRSARSIVLGSDIRVEVKRSGGTAALPSLVEDNLLRIGQEAVTNAVKHARPSRVVLELVTGPESVILTIGDDGSSGARPASKPGHFGLTGMRERVLRLGGTLQIAPRAGGGTVVRVEVPLRNGNPKTPNEPAPSATRQDPRGG